MSRWTVPALDRLSAHVSTDARALESLLSLVDPTLSFHAVHARVISVVAETHDTNTYWLRPNARFDGFRAGEFIELQLKLEGRALSRCYSLSSAQRRDRLISITVKRVPGGVVSNWLADHVRPGHVLTLSQARGRFVLPRDVPAKLLMLSAGSGITPVMSMLRQLTSTAGQREREIAFLHFARSPRDIIFRAELERIAAARPNVRVMVCVERDEGMAWSGGCGRFDEARLREFAPDFRSLDTYLCGPTGFMRSVVQTFERADADLSRLRFERFSVERESSALLDEAQLIRFVRSGAEILSNRPRTILEEAERAGVRIESGCRAGNCGTCRCRKTRGVVVDVTTGLASQAGEEFIYPCISVARGPVELEL